MSIGEIAVDTEEPVSSRVLPIPEPSIEIMPEQSSISRSPSAVDMINCKELPVCFPTAGTLLPIGRDHSKPESAGVEVRGRTCSEEFSLFPELMIVLKAVFLAENRSASPSRFLALAADAQTLASFVSFRVSSSRLFSLLLYWHHSISLYHDKAVFEYHARSE